MGIQKTSWLFLETKELSELGVRLTYSGDQPHLLRLVHGITEEVAKNFPSRLPLYVEEKESLICISVGETTKQRTDLKISFQTQNPSSSLVYFSSVLAVKNDPNHAQSRITRADLKKWVDRIIIEEKSENHHTAAIENFQ